MLFIFNAVDGPLTKQMGQRVEAIVKPESSCLDGLIDHARPILRGNDSDLTLAINLVNMIE